MRKRLEIARRPRGAGTSAVQCFLYETEHETDTVATALTALNERPELRDTEGAAADPIQWACSCLQKKCGACAMLVNGRPTLACNAQLRDYPETVRLEPLKKFPVIADLMVDRSVLYENLKSLRLWLASPAEGTEAGMGVAYEASRCLQCGCCLEVCPNFYPEGLFSGMAAAVPFSRLLAQLPDSERKEAAGLYRRRFFNGCGKSLACRNICPAEIEVERLLVNSNAIAVWKKFFQRRLVQ